MLGNRIKRIRELKGIKQETMADALGISQQMYSQIEQGQAKITAQRLEKIASTFKLSLESLIEFDAQKMFEGNHFNFDNNSNNIQNNTIDFETILKEIKEAHHNHIADLKQQLDEKQKIIDSLLATKAS